MEILFMQLLNHAMYMSIKQHVTTRNNKRSFYMSIFYNLFTLLRYIQLINVDNKTI